MSKRVLVTGGAGFIGSNFIRYLLKMRPSWEVVNLDKLTYAGNLENLRDVEGSPKYRFVRGDIADRQKIASLFGREKFHYVINFAAESHVDRSILDATPFVETNVKGTQVLLEAARENGVERFVQVSTDEVYGSLGEEGKFTEESPLKPNSPYSATKAAADLLCRSYYQAYGIPVIVTRCSNNYGPYQFPEKLIPLMIRNALKGEKLPIYGEGKNVRDWIFVEDHCAALLKVLEEGKPGEIYNIGGNCEKRNIEVVETLCQILEERLDRRGKIRALITHIPDPRGKAHDYRYALDTTKMERELNWRPTVRFEEGIRRTVEWYLSHQDWVENVITGEYRSYYQKVYGVSLS